MRSTKVLLALSLACASMALAPIANAATPTVENSATSAATSTSENSESFVGPDGAKRSLSEVKDSSIAGLRIGLAKGDRVQISKDGQTAVWITSGGTRLIEFNNPSSDGQRARFVFTGGVLTAAAATPSKGDGYTAYRSCLKAKIVSWGWNTLWDGLVCVPVGVATAGAAGFMCGVAGSGISTFVPWEKVCK